MSTNLFQHTVYKTHFSDVRENLRDTRTSNHHHSNTTKSSSSSSHKTTSAEKWANAMTIFSTVASVAMTGLSMVNMAQSIFGKGGSTAGATDAISGIGNLLGLSQTKKTTNSGSNLDKSVFTTAKEQGKSPSFTSSKTDSNYVQLGAGKIDASSLASQQGANDLASAVESYNKSGDVTGLQKTIAQQEKEYSDNVQKIGKLTEKATKEINEANEDYLNAGIANENQQKACDDSKEKLNGAEATVGTDKTAIVTAQGSVTLAEGKIAAAKTQQALQAAGGTTAGDCGLAAAEEELRIAKANLTQAEDKLKTDEKTRDEIKITLAKEQEKLIKTQKDVETAKTKLETTKTKQTGTNSEIAITKKNNEALFLALAKAKAALPSYAKGSTELESIKNADVKKLNVKS